MALLCFLVVLAMPRPAWPDDVLKGVALAIGNGDYASLPHLPNPAKDADDLEKLFDGLGFRAEARSDRDLRRLKRDLDDFVEDAEGADVAILSYSGHGVEAGGENWLVPVDADLSALDDASEKLVALSPIVKRLQSKVPIVIVLLDACRNSPFPAGATLKVSTDAPPVAISASGLGDTRSAVPIGGKTDDGRDNLGTVIGFSAAPGKPALDGAPGANSPYAAAVLKHLDALAGTEFGTVMRMITEEVYLKTGGRQRPWVNESLRRLIYFGKAPPRPTGEEGDILAERRALLVTVAALPDFERRQVEAAAADGGVPMDALYGMLRALGQDAPRDPVELEEILRSQTERLKEIIAERETLTNPDPEIVRLSRLAEKAFSEGALKTAIALNERAKARVEELEATVADTEAEIRDRRIEFAKVYARSAEAYEIAFDHLGAARDYARAFEHVERWDARLAWQYKQSEMVALIDHGKYSGDNAALERAIEAGEQAMQIAVGFEDDYRAATWYYLGRALFTLGERESGMERLERAIVAYEAALLEWPRESEPLDWALAQSDLASVLAILGQREGSTERLEAAIKAYRLALEERTRERVPLGWAETQNNLGAVLQALGDRKAEPALLEQAVASYRAALEVWSRGNAPLSWAIAQNNLGSALESLGWFESGTESFEQSLVAYQAALLEWPRERVPLWWAAAHNNIGNALRAIGERENNIEKLEQSVEHFELALEETTRKRAPLEWAKVQHNLGIALRSVGYRDPGAARLMKAVDAFEAALEERRRELVPLDWAETQHHLGVALGMLAERENSAAYLRQAIDAFHAALEERTLRLAPKDWARTQSDLAYALRLLGEREEGTRRLEEAVEANLNALQVWNRTETAFDWGETQHNLGIALRLIGVRESNPERLADAVNAFFAALEVRSRRTMPFDWAWTQHELGIALAELGHMTGRASDLEAGRRAIDAAWNVHREFGDNSYDDYFRDRLATIDALLAQMK